MTFILPLLIVSGFLNYVFGILGIISFAILVYIIYLIILIPTFRALAEKESQPPREGDVFEIIMDDETRSRLFSIGLLDADVRTQIQGIKEDHLVLKFHKEKDMEEYEVIVVPNGDVYYRRPHAAKLEHLKEPDRFESSELIGHPTTFRLAAVVQHGRALQYLEFELSCDFFINRLGVEKLKFLLTLKKIYPGVDRLKPVKKGIYRFARQRSEESEIPDDV